ncbi:hypothetical protein OJ997_27680 [Solirubrobacter phytolaccae]|uniref:Uncharacterized protein n=1 Tax=Solirubrobacter phytolaccae TaxID=1404360 RepID=A0A9X3NHQ4_9ACTN|nr:hypothetical protein [Solirubrobacter phytolaccae]MDA0184121.1 hypothetical protein [Solirubrobacter phytolaccae]
MITVTATYGPTGDFGTSQTITQLAVTAAAGDVLVAAISRSSYTAGASFSDAGGNSWTTVLDIDHSAASTGFAVGICLVTSGFTGNVVGTFFDSAFSNRQIVVHRLNGLATSAVVDAAPAPTQHSGGVNVNAASNSTGTLGQADEIAIGIVAGAATATYVPGAGWTELSDFAQGSVTLQTAYQIVSATTALQYTATASAADAWTCGVLTLNGRGSGRSLAASSHADRSVLRRPASVPSDETEPTKFCRPCGATKPVDDFGIDRSRRDGRMNRCKVCDRARGRAYYSRVTQGTQVTATAEDA